MKIFTSEVVPTAGAPNSEAPLVEKVRSTRQVARSRTLTPSFRLHLKIWHLSRGIKRRCSVASAADSGGPQHPGHRHRPGRRRRGAHRSAGGRATPQQPVRSPGSPRLPTSSQRRVRLPRGLHHQASTPDCSQSGVFVCGVAQRRGVWGGFACADPCAVPACVPPVCLYSALCSLKTCGNFDAVAHAEVVAGQRVTCVPKRAVVFRAAQAVAIHWSGSVAPDGPAPDGIWRGRITANNRCRLRAAIRCRRPQCWRRRSPDIRRLTPCTPGAPLSPVTRHLPQKDGPRLSARKIWTS